MQRARTFFSEFCVFGRAALRQADHSEAYWLPCTATFCRARQISYQMTCFGFLLEGLPLFSATPWAYGAVSGVHSEISLD